jgi:hypothetical protein
MSRLLRRAESKRYHSEQEMILVIAGISPGEEYKDWLNYKVTAR